VRFWNTWKYCPSCALNASPPGLYVVGDRNATVKTRAFIRTDGSFVTRFDFGGDEEDEDDVVGAREAVEEPGRGAIGIATSPVLLCAGYPSHCLPDRTHLIHCGRVSSHLTLRFLVKGRKQKRGRSPGVASSTHLQLLHPVLTFGRLALLCLVGFAALPISDISRDCVVRLHFSMAIARSHCCPRYASLGECVSVLELCSYCKLSTGVRIRRNDML